MQFHWKHTETQGIFSEAARDEEHDDGDELTNEIGEADRSVPEVKMPVEYKEAGVDIRDILHPGIRSPQQFFIQHITTRPASHYVSSTPTQDIRHRTSSW